MSVTFHDMNINKGKAQVSILVNEGESASVTFHILNIIKGKARCYLYGYNQRQGARRLL